MCRFMVDDLYHVAIKVFDLHETICFYIDILGMYEVERPPFGYPGAWLASTDSKILIHLYAGKQGLSNDGARILGTGAIDHISIFCHGFFDLISRLVCHDIIWKEYEVPNTSLWQVFIYDPNRVLIELTFDSKRENILNREISKKNLYTAGQDF